jgi:hypothetical protein
MRQGIAARGMIGAAGKAALHLQVSALSATT